MKPRPNVALIIETSSTYGRQILHGIARYQRAHEGWSLFLEERESRIPPPEWLLEYGCDGVICRSTTPELAQLLRDHAIATVDLNDHYGYLGLPRIGSDMRALGRLAVEHLLERGFRQFAFYGIQDERWSVGRLAGVREAVQGRGELCSVFEHPNARLHRNVWQEERETLCNWLRALPRPLGIVACNDVRAHYVLDACRVLGFAVPEEVAVVGVDNGETFCELCQPSLSSVIPDAERIGFEAAALLDRLMGGELNGDTAAELLLPPQGIAVRQSSDVLAIDDPTIAAALQFIREHACEGITVTDVLARVPLSRSGLERGFRQFLGHSPQAEIRAVRLQKVKQLLTQTDWPLTRIAEATGFDFPNYMMAQFKRLTGTTPSEWRRDKRAS